MRSRSYFPFRKTYKEPAPTSSTSSFFIYRFMLKSQLKRISNKGLLKYYQLFKFPQLILNSTGGLRQAKI